MILVTGATGLIGSYIVRELIFRNHPVRILKRKTSDLSLLSDLIHKVEVVDGDILDVLSLEEAFKGVSFVIHAAGFISFDKKDTKLLHKINVEGTANVVNTALKFSTKKLIHISSVSAIGRKKGVNEIKEDFKWEDQSVNIYAKSKHLAELEIFRGSSEGLSVAILNPSVVLGPGNWENGSTKVFKYIWDKRSFYTDGNLNYVDVRDVASAAVSLLDSNSSNERFILNAGTTTYSDLFTKIAKLFYLPGPRIKLSKKVLLVIAFLEKIRTLICSTRAVITKESAEAAFSQTRYLNNKAKETLDITFKDLDETLKWVCEELIKKYKLQINK